MNMIKITFKKQFFVFMLLLFCGAVSHAADDLITQQITIKLEKAGTLSNRIGSSKKYKITNLKITGEINGADLYFICGMASDYTANKNQGKLTTLDLSDAKIVEGRGGDNYTYNDALQYRNFAGCNVLVNLSLPSDMTWIGEEVFRDCSNLANLYLPVSITWIGGEAFKGCCRLTNLVLPSSLTSIKWGIFCGCSSLTSISFPYSVTGIEDEAFKGCSSLTSLTIPSNFTYVGNNAFENCSSLNSIYVYTEKMPTMGGHVFDGCDAAKCTVYVPKGTYDDYWLSEFGYFKNIVEFDVTGVDKVTTSTDTKEVSRYSVNGQRLSAPTKGLNIVKYSDGSVKKVAVQ